MNERKLRCMAIDIFEQDEGREYDADNDYDFDEIVKITRFLHTEKPTYRMEQAAEDWEHFRQIRSGGILKPPITLLRVECSGDRRFIEVWINHELAGVLEASEDETVEFIKLLTEQKGGTHET